MIHLSLSSADIHAVVLGEGCTGYTHPSKIYSVMAMGRPILYIGPKQSYITDMLNGSPGNICVEHDQGELLVGELRSFAEKRPDEWDAIGSRNMAYFDELLAKDKLTSRFVSRLKLLLSVNPSRSTVEVLKGPVSR